MQKNDPAHQATPQPTEATEKRDRQIEISAGSNRKTAVTILLRPGANLEVGVKQMNAEGKAVSLERKSFFNPIDPGNFVEDIPEEESSPMSAPPPGLLRKFKTSWQMWLLLAALVVYLATRFIGLDVYPIYFFTDEAIQTVSASDLVNNNFKDYHDELLPTYFVNGGQYNLGTSVYLQILPWLMFGKSVWVTRGTSVLIGLLAALGIGLILKNNFKSNYAFIGILVLCITPAWFLHSRTAFEVVIAVSFYAGFLYTYLQYRQGKPKYLFAAVGFGALCFYSYSPAQMVMAVTAAALLLIDIRTHIKNWKVILIGIGIAVVLAIPYIRFIILHPDENRRHLEILDSYWIQSIPFTDKLGIFFKEYLKLINPFYWFIPNGVDLERHVMKGYGHLLRWTLPFFIIGFGVVLRYIKKPEYRTLLVAVIAAPSGSALAGAAVTRALFMVIPAVLITAIGIDQVLKWIEKLKVVQWAVAGVVFAGLTTFSGFMVNDALVNGPRWYSNYSLGGQQFGAQQIFTEIKSMLKKDPGKKIYLSPSWANGTDVLARFFFDDPLPFRMGSIDAFLNTYQEIEEQETFILIPEEMERAQASHKFEPFDILKTVNTPDGNPGFYFVHLTYVSNIQEIFAAEEAARNVLETANLTDTQGRMLTVGYSLLDMGTIENIFDGNGETMVRTSEANPLRLQIGFSDPSQINAVTIRIGGTPSILEVTFVPADGSPKQTLSREVPDANEIRDVTLELDKALVVKEILISIKNKNDPERAHVHCWEVTLQ